jgi:hypothetical protein
MSIVDAVRLFARPDRRARDTSRKTYDDVLAHAMCGIYIARSRQDSKGRSRPPRIVDEIAPSSIFRRLLMHSGRHSMVLNAGDLSCPYRPCIVATASVTSMVIRYGATIYTQISPHEVWTQPVLIYSTMPINASLAGDASRYSHCISLPPTDGYPSLHYTTGSPFWDSHYGTIMADATACFALFGVFLIHDLDAYPLDAPLDSFRMFRHMRDIDWLDSSVLPVLPTITDWDRLTCVMSEALQ